jgi:hypothetical protein
VAGLSRAQRGGGHMSDPSAWPHLENLVTHGGQVTIGKIHPIECAAIAGNGKKMLAALLRRDGESLAEFLQRLEQAVEEAQTSARVTIEIKGLG